MHACRSSQKFGRRCPPPLGEHTLGWPLIKSAPFHRECYHAKSSRWGQAARAYLRRSSGKKIVSHLSMSLKVMCLTRTVFEINGHFDRKSLIFPTPVYLNPHWGGSRRNFVTGLKNYDASNRMSKMWWRCNSFTDEWTDGIQGVARNLIWGIRFN